MITVFIADDHPVVLSGLKAFVDADRDFTVVGTAQDGRTTVEGIAELRPDLAVVDLNMPLANGLEVLTSLGQMGIATRIVVLAAAASDSEVHSLISAGVSGLLFKDAAANELLACIKAVAEGKRWYSPSIVDSLTRHEQHGMAWLSSLATLTPRERRVATLVGLGRSNKEIAFELDLSEGTVKIHLHSIFRKLGLTKRAELVTLSADVDEPR